MKCQRAVFLALCVVILVNAGVIKRNNEKPAKFAADQEIKNVTGRLA